MNELHPYQPIGVYQTQPLAPSQPVPEQPSLDRKLGVFWGRVSIVCFLLTPLVSILGFIIVVFRVKWARATSTGESDMGIPTEMFFGAPITALLTVLTLFLILGIGTIAGIKASIRKNTVGMWWLGLNLFGFFPAASLMIILPIVGISSDG